MKELKIHFLNTIWSDAIVLENNNHYAMCDTASLFYYPMVKKHLEDYTNGHLDFIILTHFHSDHYSNIVNIINDFKVDKLYLKHYYGLDGTTSSGYESNEEYIQNELKKYEEIISSAKSNNVEIIFVDDTNKDPYIIDFNGINLELYETNNNLYYLYSDINSPYYGQKPFNENFDSMIVFININNHPIFLGGDLPCSNTEVELLHHQAIRVLKKIYQEHNIDHIDIYKSCHHGGGGTNPLELCELLKSKYVVITNTARWLDNYPTFDNLREAYKDVTILTTDHQKYIFTINNDITYQEIKEESLFIILNKN